jgi:hypothetical protein
MNESIEEIKKRHEKDSITLKEYEREQENEFVKKNIGKWFYNTDFTDVFYKILPSDQFQNCRVLAVTYNRHQDYDVSIIHRIDLLSVNEVGKGNFSRQEIVRQFEDFMRLITKEVLAIK